MVQYEVMELSHHAQKDYRCSYTAVLVCDIRIHCKSVSFSEHHKAVHYT